MPIPKSSEIEAPGGRFSPISRVVVFVSFHYHTQKRALLKTQNHLGCVAFFFSFFLTSFSACMSEKWRGSFILVILLGGF